MTKIDPPDWHKELEEAFKFQQNNQISEASQQFEKVLAKDPNQPDALHGLGMAYAQRGEFPKAVSLLQQAVQFAPTIAEFHNNLGNAYKAVGQTNEAMKHYHEALRLKSPYPQAHNNLGSLLYRIGKMEEAAEHFQRSLRMDPDSVDTHFNLGLCLVMLDRLVEAVSHFEVVLQRRPNHLSAMHNLGIAYCVLKQFSESEKLLLEVTKREPNNIDALFHLAVVQSGLGKLNEAKTLYEQILKIDKSHANTHHNLATLYLHINDPQQARLHYQEALKLEPRNKTAQHMIAALTGETLSEGAPLEYTRALFEQYAFNYDNHVKSHLRYQVPTKMREAIAPFTKNIKEPWRALDMGCGTGLCAPLFADVVGHLTGIDISENMIAVAKQQGGYQNLVVTDILSFLEHKFNQYDLILAADVFVYFGELETLFKLMRQALKPQGMVCFSIESLTEEERTQHPNYPHFQLRPTGRYAHSTTYIQSLAQHYHYTVLSQTDAILRYQEEQPVGGQIIVLQRIN